MRRLGVTLAALALLAAGCNSDEQRKPPAKLDPKRFTTRIDNPWFPITPGARWVYRETEDGATQRVEVKVTDRTKLIAGVRARVVHDVVTEGGRLIEDTFDWFAQDRDGNVWYLGEDTKEYAGGRVSTKGSWQAGIDGAQAGVVMPAHPRAGQSYRQEYLKGEAEDQARVLSVDEKAEVPFGFYERTVMTKDFTALEPRLLEHKFYARGVGPVMTITTAGGSGREVLVSFKR
jgi:hypothetical protein